MAETSVVTHRDDVAALLETWFARADQPPWTHPRDHVGGQLAKIHAVLAEQERSAAVAGVERGARTVHGVITRLPEETALAEHVAAARSGRAAPAVEVGVHLEVHGEAWTVRPGSPVAAGARAPRPAVTVAVSSLQDAAAVQWTPVGWRIVDISEAGEWFSRHFCTHVTGRARIGVVRLESLMVFRGDLPDVLGLYVALHNPADHVVEVTPATQERVLFRRQSAWHLEPRSTTVVGINSAADADGLTSAWTVGRGLRAARGVLDIGYAGPEHPGALGWCVAA